MAFEQILTERRDRVGILTLNRPERLNAYTARMQDEWREAIGAWNADPAVGAVVVTGAGRAFCAGADVGGWSEEIKAREAGEETERQQRAPQTESWTEFVMHSKPIICAINGPAVGVGLTMALPCDVRIASDRAGLSMRFIRMGLIPELGSTGLLTSIVGITHALELMLSGRIIEAEEAGRIGLVNRVVPHDDLMDVAMTTAREIADNPSENLLAIKRLAWEAVADPNIVGVMKREGVEFAAAQARPGWKEAVNAFLEKRPPDFHRA